MTDTTAMSGAEWLARALAGTGMSHVFFVESTLRRTLLHLSDLGVRPILAHSEKAAAYMADGYARVAGRPGVCMAQSVGAANLAAGLQDAWLGRSPVIAFSGRKEPWMQHRNAYQEIPHAPLFSAVTKFSAPVETTSDLPRLLRQAWRAALADPARPTHLDFNGLQGDVIELGQTSEPTMIETEPRAMPVHRPVADEGDLERAAAILSNAGRIAIVAGDGAVVSQAGPEILALAEALAAPVATTLGARALIPTTHRLAVGVAGSYSAPPANRIVHSADLVLFIGCDTGDQVTLNWRIPPLSTPIVQIEADPLEIGRSYPNTTGLLGDPKASVARLTQLIGQPSRDPSFAEEAAGIVAEWRASMAPLAQKDTAPISVERLCAEVTRALPADGVLVADTGLFRHLDRHHGRSKRGGPDLPARRRLARLGHAGGHGRQMRRRRSHCGLFYRRRRFLLSPAGIGVGAPLPHPGRVHRQQQLRLWPELDRREPHRGGPRRPRRRTDSLWADRF